MVTIQERGVATTQEEVWSLSKKGVWSTYLWYEPNKVPDNQHITLSLDITELSNTMEVTLEHLLHDSKW